MARKFRSISIRHTSYSSWPAPIGSRISELSRARSSTRGRQPRMRRQERFLMALRHREDAVGLFQQPVGRRLTLVRSQVDAGTPGHLDRLGTGRQTGLRRHSGRKNHVAMVCQFLLGAVQTIGQHLAKKSLGKRTPARVAGADKQEQLAGQAADHRLLHDSRLNDRPRSCLDFHHRRRLRIAAFAIVDYQFHVVVQGCQNAGRRDERAAIVAAFAPGNQAAPASAASPPECIRARERESKAGHPAPRRYASRAAALRRGPFRSPWAKASVTGPGQHRRARR